MKEQTETDTTADDDNDDIASFTTQETTAIRPQTRDRCTRDRLGAISSPDEPARAGIRRASRGPRRMFAPAPALSTSSARFTNSAQWHTWLTGKEAFSFYSIFASQLRTSGPNPSICTSSHRFDADLIQRNDWHHRVRQPPCHGRSRVHQHQVALYSAAKVPSQFT